MKKKFLPSFQPPRLVRAASGFYIVWYEQNPGTGLLERFRATFNLNRIASKKDRHARAMVILEDISRCLAGGGYAYAGQQEKAIGLTPLSEAIEMARKLKTNSSSRNTINSYNSIARVFLAWARGQRIDQGPTIRFSKLQAVAFLDHLRHDRGIGGRTHNNYLISMKAIWTELIDRGLAENNPWRQIRTVRDGGKTRRQFSPVEMEIVARYAAANHPALFCAILLQYYCFVRPNEIRQLRRRDFDFSAGTLRIMPTVAKTRKARLVTLPEHVRAFFAARYDATPSGNFIWGPKMNPDPIHPLSRNRLYRLHRDVLEKLYRLKHLADIAGLSFYSWKDTGLTDHARNISLLDLMQQAGHHDPKITMVYVHQGKENAAFREMKGELIGGEKK